MTHILIRTTNSTNGAYTENRYFRDSSFNKVKSDERASYLSTAKTGNTPAQNRIDIAPLADMELESEECSVTRQNGEKTETMPLYSPEINLESEISYFELSRSQKHWLSIGENFGKWLLKQKTGI